MKFREKNFKPFLFFFSFLQTFLSLPISYAPTPIHSDSLIDFKKTFLQQEILRKNKYLSQNFGIDLVSAAKNSPRISEISQGILQKPALSIPNEKSEVNIYDNKEISTNLYNNNKYSSFPQSFLQNDAEKTKNNNQNFYYESNLRNYYTNDDFEYNPYELNSNSFNNRQYGNTFAGKSEEFSLKKPSNLVYYQNNNIRMKNQKNNNNFRFKEEILPKNENTKKPIEENKSIEEIVKEIKSDIERKMLMEITSNFSRFSDNIHNLIQQVSKISNETIKSTEIEKKILLTEKTPNENKEKEEEIAFLKKSFEEIKRNQKEKQDRLNVSVIKDLINSQIENQFKRYFELVPKNENLREENKTIGKIEKNQDKNENLYQKEQASFSQRELEKEVIDNFFGEINKADKWKLLDTENQQKNSMIEYFSYNF